MQSMCGKLRLVAKQAFNNLKNAELKPIASFDSKFFGCSIPSSAFNSSHRSNFASGLLLSKNFGTTSCGIPSALRSCGGLSLASNHSVSSVLTLPNRNLSTSESTSQDVSVSSDVPPQRIKFKRLDKTARHIMQIIDKESVEEVKAAREMPVIKPGYTVQLRVEVPENKRRVTTLKGIVIAMRNAGLNSTFRIRRLVAGVGIESLFPLYSPNIKEIKVLDKKKVRRTKLYYLRGKMNALKKQ
ncbi:hypothetical protein ABFS83_09G013300 [Erythranthe nasuta]